MVLRSEVIVWLVVFMIEVLMIVVGNVFLIVKFIGIGKLYRCSLYLLINLVVVDIFVGVCVVLMFVYFIGG